MFGAIGKERSKLLAVIAVAAVMLACVVVLMPVDAEDSTVDIEYTSISPSDFLALDTDSDGVITLEDDYRITGVTALTGDLKLITNGHSLITSGDMFRIGADGIDIEIDATAGGNLTAGASGRSSIIWGNYYEANVTVNGGVYTSDDPFTLCGNNKVDGLTTFSIEDATINGNTSGIWLSYGAIGTATITGCTVSATHPMYIATVQSATISDCTIDGTSFGIEIKAGDVDINNCIIHNEKFLADDSVGMSQTGGSMAPITINNGYCNSAQTTYVDVTISNITVTCDAEGYTPVVVTSYYETESAKNDSDISVTWEGASNSDVTFCPTQSAATMSVNGFVAVDTPERLAAAVDNGSNVVLADDITATVEIDAGQTITLDLNGFKLTNSDGSHTISNNGTLTIIDSSKSKSGAVDNTTHGRAAIYNAVGAIAILNGGLYERSAEAGIDANNNGGNSFYTIQNQGTMTVNDGVVVKNSGKYSSCFTNGWMEGIDAPFVNGVDGVRVTASLIINGGVFDGGLNTIKNDDLGVLEINGGSFVNYAQYAFMNAHVATINDGEFDSNTEYSIYCYGADPDDGGNAYIGDGKLILNGGSFSGGIIMMGGSTLETDDDGISLIAGNIIELRENANVDGTLVGPDGVSTTISGFTAKSTTTITAGSLVIDGSWVGEMTVSGDDIVFTGSLSEEAHITIKPQADGTPTNITWRDFADNGATIEYLDNEGNDAESSDVANQIYENATISGVTIDTVYPDGGYIYDGEAQPLPTITVSVTDGQVSTSGFLQAAEDGAPGSFVAEDGLSYYWATSIEDATIWHGGETVSAAIDAGSYTVKYGYAVDGTVHVTECSWIIERATLTITVDEDKVYDGEEMSYDITADDVSGLGTGDSITGGTIITTGSDVGDYTDEATDWILDGLSTSNGIANYDIVYGSISLEITKAPLTITVDADDVYDGEEFVYSIIEGDVDGLIGGETLTGTLTTTGSDVDDYTYSDDEIISEISISSDVDNYEITYNVTLIITPKNLTITGATIGDKTYDGTTDATVTYVTFGGLIAGESISGADYTATATFDDANAGTDKSISLTVEAVAGSVVLQNYSLPDGATVLDGYTIFKREITVTGGTVPDKTYDGTRSGIVTAVTFGGLIAGESLNIGKDFTATAEYPWGPDAGTEANNYLKMATITVILNENLNYIFAGNSPTAVSPEVSSHILPIEITKGMVDVSYAPSGDGIQVSITVSSDSMSPSGLMVTHTPAEGTSSTENPFVVEQSARYTITLSTTDGNWSVPDGFQMVIEVELNKVNYYTKSTIDGRYELEQTDVGESVRTPNATNIPDGYILAGWSTTENGPKEYGVDVNIDVPASGLNLYAVYVEDTGDVDPEPSGPTVSIDIPDSFAIGEEIEFSISTTRGDYAGGYVQGTGVFEGIPGVDYIIWYKINNGQWYLWEDGNFGPEGGFPLIDATSEFRIQFINAGTYDLTVQIVTVDGGDVVCETTAVVNVPAESTLGYHVIDAVDFVYIDDAGDYNANAYEYAADLSADANGVVATYGSEYYDALVAYISNNATDEQKAMAASVMNDFARYMGALYRSSDGDVGRVYFNGTEYVWKADADGDWLHGSNWRDANGVSLTSVVTDYIEATQNTRIVMEIAVPGDERQVLTYGAVFEDAPAPEIQYYDVTIEGEGVAIYIDGLRYFPGTYSMAEGEHTIGVEVLSGYTGTPVISNVTDGKFTVNSEMTIAITGVTEVELPEPEKELPGIEFDMPVFTAGQDDAFRVTFIANDYVGQTVTVRATFGGDPSDITSIRYWNVNINDWTTMTAEYDGSYVYGGSGFPLSDATSAFRATFANAGVYTLTVHIYIDGAEITSATETFIVEEAVVSEYYNVTFNVDGNTSTVRVLAGEYILLATPFKDGYTFDGWYVEGDDTALYTLYYTPSKDVTLIAKFTENQVITEQTYSVAFGEVHTQDGLKAGDVVTMPVVTPEENYRLVGWGTENGIVLTGQQYYVYAADDADEDGTITLEPVFEKYVFTVTVSGGENGTIGTETFSVEMGGTAVITGIQADPGYYVESVTATGGYTVVDFNGSYVIFDVAEDITVTVAFAADPGAMDITMTAELTEGGVLVTMRSNDGGDLPTGIIQIVYSYTVYDSELGINVPEFRTIEIDYTAVGQTGTTQFVEMTFEPTATFAHAEFMVGEEVRAQSGYFRAFLES